jgi:hypothetical protein
VNDHVLPVGPLPGFPHLVLDRVQHLPVARVAAGGEIVAVGISVAQVLPDRLLGLAAHLHELVAVQHVHPAQRLRLAGVGVVGDARLADGAGALLGGDEHHAVGAARPVDRRGAGVLQDLDRLDVGGLQVVEAAGHRDAVEHVERVVPGLERPGAADAHLGAVAGLVARGDHVHAGDAPLQRLGDVDLGRLGDLLGAHRGHRAGHVTLRLRAVADRDDLLEDDRLLHQPEVRGHRPPRRDHDVGGGVGREADAGDPQAVRAGLHREGVAAVVAGGGAGRRPDHDDLDAGERLPALGGRDRAGDPARRHLRPHRGAGEREGEQTTGDEPTTLHDWLASETGEWRNNAKPAVA